MKGKSLHELKSRALDFYKEFKDAKYEKGEANIFWHEFFKVFGISSNKIASYEKNVQLAGDRQGFIDLFWKGTLIVEHKSRNDKNAPVVLDKAFKQATDYFSGLDKDDLPKYIIVSDFKRIRLYDVSLSDNQYTEFNLEDLHKNLHHFGFITGLTQKKYDKEEPANIKATKLMADLHKALLDNGYSGHELQQFLERILFCLFADDTGIFNKDSFTWYIEECTRKDGSDLGAKLNELFEVLNTPENERQRNLDEKLNEFPYVNGSLYRERLRTPAFDEHTRKILLKCCRFYWNEISPIIFGSMFQAVIAKEKRDDLGAHYTSERNILKAIDGLFYNSLRIEYESIKNNLKKLNEFHARLGNLKFLDPACGCGNFLICTYKKLRELEIEVLKQKRKLTRHEHSIGDQLITLASVIPLSNFYGIEYEESAGRIAEVAMWLVEHQMNIKAQLELEGTMNPIIPLRDTASIMIGNALRLDWQQIVPASELSFILGNPPFIAKKNRTAEQQEDMKHIFNEGAGVLDYVCAWYVKAADYMQGTRIRAAFVSTNSITQGEQPDVLWKYLNSRNVIIRFAHRTFRWDNESKGKKAQVFVVIIGFTIGEIEDQKLLFDYLDVKGEPIEVKVKRINPYLVDAENITIPKRRAPISKVPKISFGNMPNDGGHFLLTDEEKKELLRQEPEARKFIKPLISSDEFINGENRWCIWLENANPSEWRNLIHIRERIEKVKEVRNKSRRPATKKLSATPYLFGEIRQPKTTYLLLPRHSSENRKYIPIGILPPTNIAGDSCLFIPTNSLFHMGVMMSTLHMTWLRFVGGRIKSDYRYSAEIVYNNFPFPEEVNPKQKTQIEDKVQEILSIRKKYNTSLANLYDDESMPADLQKAHRELDKLVEKCYEKSSFKSDNERIEYLFELYSHKAMRQTSLNV